MGLMSALFFFLSSLEASAGGESPAAEGDLRKRLKFMQALTPVVKKLTNAILQIILYPMAWADYLPMDSVTGRVIDYIVTNFIRNRSIRIYEKDVFSFVTKAARKKKNLSTSKCGRTYEHLVASTDALPLSYKILVSAKATKARVMWQTRGTQRMFSAKYLLGRSKYCLKFSVTWGRLKISRWTFHSWTIFEACPINCLRFSFAKFFTFYSPGWAIFRRKKTLQFRMQNVMGE